MAAFLQVTDRRGDDWQESTSDLKLLVRGSLSQPVANGFLRFARANSLWRR